MVEFSLTGDDKIIRSFAQETANVKRLYAALAEALGPYPDVTKVTIRTSQDYANGQRSSETSVWLTQDESVVRPAILNIPVVDTLTVRDVALAISSDVLKIIGFPGAGLSHQAVAFAMISFQDRTIVTKTHYSGGCVIPQNYHMKVE